MSQEPILVTVTTGVHGQRLSIQSGGTGSAEVELVPGNTAPNGLLNCEVQWFNVKGDDYERFVIAAVGDAYVLDTTCQGNGKPRNIHFMAQGAAGGDIQHALTVYGDASVDLNGARFVKDGIVYGETRTRVADWTNTGDVRLVLATRTTEPADDPTDSCSVEFHRGGVRKWALGLNFAGDDADTLDFWSPGRRSGLPGSALSLTQGGDVILGAPGGAGYPYIPAVIGAPGGVPPAEPGYVPLCYDTVGHRLWVYDDGEWRAL
jgi:hypothetical protein